MEIFDDDTSATPTVTIPRLTVDTDLTFTLTVVGRGTSKMGPDFPVGTGTAPDTDTAIVTVNVGGICGRTPEVRDALVAVIPDVDHCADVTDEHLAAISGTLSVSNLGIPALAAGDFDGLTALTELDLNRNRLTSLPAGVFDELTALTKLNLALNALTLSAGDFYELTSLTELNLNGNKQTMLPAGVFDRLAALTSLYLNNNELTSLSDDVFLSLTLLTRLDLSSNKLDTLSDNVFDGLTALQTLALYNNALDTLPDNVFDKLTELTALYLSGNPGAPFRPAAVALPDGGTVSTTGGTLTLDGSGSGGAWGRNVTYSWALPRPASGVTIDDDTSAMPAVTFPVLTADTELTFTLTVTGFGGTDGIAPGTDTATVIVTASADATLESLTVNDGTSDLPLAPPFVSDVHIYTAVVGKAVTTVTLTAMTTDSGATVTAVTLNLTAIADTDFTDGIEVPSLLAGENGIVVTVRAEDTSTTQTYTVTVTREANTAPTAINSSVTTDEDTPHTFATTQFSFADDDGDALVSVTVVTPPAAGALALGGAAVTADQAVSAADIGQLVFTPASNAHGQDYASFTFKVSDGIDESDSAYTMTVHVTAVNDAATGAPGISGTAQVGEKLTAGQGDIDDIDGLPTAFPGDYSFQWVRVDADGISNPTDISGETGSTYTPADADVGKKLQVKVSFMDDDNNFEELTSEAYPASGTVEAAPNVAPVFTTSETFDVAENQTAVGTVQATDADADDDVTGYAIQGGADEALFVIGPTSGELAFRAAPNHEAAADAGGNNTYVVDVRATSGAGIREKTTDQTITVTVTDVDEPPEPPLISVANARVREGPGAVLAFKVTLDRASRETATVDWKTLDGRAKAGEDYVAGSGTLMFAPGETVKTVNVAVLDAAHDEGQEAMALYLWNEVGAIIADAVATGTIENSGHMPKAWLARFGRTVAEQVLDAVEDRLRASPRAGVEARLAGEALPSWDGGGSRPGGRDRLGSGEEARDAAALAKAEGAEAQAGLAALTDWLPGDRRDDPGSWSGAGSDDGRRATLRSRAVTGRDFLTGTSFALTAEAAGGAGLVSLWGRGALTRFDGRARGPGGDLRLEGEVGNAMLGADWTGGAGSRPGGRDRPGSGAGAWTAGLLLAHSRGEGSYRGAVDGGSTGGTVSSSVTGLYPYGRYRVTDRVTLWGVAGYGAGMLTLTPEDGDGKALAPLRTDMELMMAALGVRGVAVESPSEGGFELAGTSDAMVVRTSSEKTSGLEAATAGVTRVRLGLEGSWRGLAFGGHELTPSLEVGIRHDDGDAETGFGADIGPGLAWSHAKSGVSAEVSARGLLTHAAGGFREQGIAGSFSWKPRQGSDRGPSLTLSQTLGGSSQGGMDALLGRETLAGLAANDNGEDGLGNRRLELRLGYGFSAIGDRFTSTPELGLGLSNGRREMSLGWRLNMDRSGASSLELRLEATRRESANDNAEAENGIGFRLTARW